MIRTDNLTAPDRTADIETDDQINSLLSEKQNRAILALLAGDSVSAAAKRVGISRATLYRWMQDNDFQREHYKARRNSFSAAVGRLQRMADKSLKHLEKVIRNDKTPAHSRVSAIRLNLEYAWRGLELEDMDIRVGALEEYAKKNQR